MTEMFQNFNLFDWLITGGLGLLLTSTITIVVMLIKQKINTKSDILQRKVLNESTMSTLINLGTDLTTVVKGMTAMATAVDQLLEKITTSAQNNQLGVTNLASFIFECFNISNLSDEKKLKLKTLFEKTFFSDNQQFIDTLKSAKANSDIALAAANKLIATLQDEIKQKDSEILSQRIVHKTRFT